MSMQPYQLMIVGVVALFGTSSCYQASSLLSPTQKSPSGQVRFTWKGLKTQALRGECVSGVKFVDVYLRGTGANSDYSEQILDIPIGAPNTDATFSPVTIGQNYAAKIVGKDINHVPVPGAVLYTGLDVFPGPNEAPVNWDTTPVGNVLYTLATGDTNAKTKATTLNRSLLSSKLPGVHGALVKADVIATNYANETLDLNAVANLDSPTYRYTSETLNVSLTSLSNGDNVTVCADDPASESVTVISTGSTASTTLELTPFDVFDNDEWVLKAEKSGTVKTAVIADGAPAATMRFTSSGASLASFPVDLNPRYLALDSTGNVWATCQNGNSVVKLSPTGSNLGCFASGVNPRGITVDSSDNAWVAVPVDGKVYKYSPTGSLIGSYAVGTWPARPAIDGEGNVWVTNNSSNNVTKLSSTGSYIAAYATGTYPDGIAFDHDGNVWIANIASDNVSKLTSTGSSLGTFYTNDAFNVRVDQDNNVWVTQNLPNTVTKLSTTGSNLGIFPAGNGPDDLAIDPSGNVWVTSVNHNYVSKLSTSGSLIATYAVGASNPLGIAIDPANNTVWVSRWSNATLLQIAL